jgi:ribose 1,5-bisphosphate isomerase
VEQNQIVPTDLGARAAVIAGDRDAGAAELLARLLPVLDDALGQGPDAVLSVTRLVCRGQPSMAPLWHACAAAISDAESPGRFARVRAELTRAPAALARAGGIALGQLLEGAASPLLLTLSFSSSLASVLREVPDPYRLRVVCGEGRPRFEGRRMAETLAALGADVTVATDSALTSWLETASAVVVGADAIADEFWINKVGTFGLAAAAWRRGVPVYVVASRDKAMPSPMARGWQPPDADPAEVWASPGAEVSVVNRYFEAIPADLATLFLTDAGPVGPEDLQAFVARDTAAIQRLILLLS